MPPALFSATVVLPPATQSRAWSRLYRLFQHPRHCIERRHEEYELQSEIAARVTGEIQVLVPSLDGELFGAPEDDFIFSVGIYPKSSRPDFDVQDSTGRRLPVLGREARSAILASVLAAVYVDKHFHRDAATPATVATRRTYWLYVYLREGLREVISAEPTSARQAADHLQAQLRRHLTRNRPHRLPSYRLALADLCSDLSFQKLLEEFIEQNHILVWGSGHVGRTGVFSFSFQESVGHVTTVSDLADAVSIPEGYSSWIAVLVQRLRIRLPTPAVGRPDLVTKVNRRLGTLLTWLALKPLSVERKHPNADHCKSYYSKMKVGPRSEVVRYFWHHEASLPINPAAYRNDANAPLLAFRFSDEVARTGDIASVEKSMPARASADVQIDIRGGVLIGLAMSLIIFVVSALILHNGNRYVGRSTLVSFLQIFAAVPAVLVGALLHRDEAFSSFLFRGPRTLATVLAALTVFLTILIGLQASFTHLARFLALVCFSFAGFLTILFVCIACAPRLRVNTDTRWRFALVRLCSALLRRKSAKALRFAPWVVRRRDQVIYAGLSMLLSTFGAALCITVGWRLRAPIAVVDTGLSVGDALSELWLDALVAGAIVGVLILLLLTVIVVYEIVRGK
jgi:hypothetical protein